MTRIRFFLGLLGFSAAAQTRSGSITRRSYEETWGETPEQYEKRISRKAHTKPSNGECPACATVAPAVTAKALLAAVPSGTCFFLSRSEMDYSAYSVCREPRESDMPTVQRVVCGHCRCVFEMDVTR